MEHARRMPEAGCTGRAGLHGRVVRALGGPALAGLEAYEYVDLLYWLDRSRRDLVVQNPGTKGKTFGTFALRSPQRPNPIGLSRVRLEGIDGMKLRVRGLDCLDGTPLIDLKPERCAFSPKGKGRCNPQCWCGSSSDPWIAN